MGRAGPGVLNCGRAFAIGHLYFGVLTSAFAFLQVKTHVPTLPDDSELFIIGNKGEGLLKRIFRDKIIRSVAL